MGQVELLQVIADILVAAGPHDHREDRLAARARLGEFGEAPLGIEPVAGQQQDDGLGALQFVVEHLLPFGAGRDALIGVDIEEATVEPLAAQPGKQILSHRGIAACMTDEDPRHENSGLASRRKYSRAKLYRKPRRKKGITVGPAPARHGLLGGPVE